MDKTECWKLLGKWQLAIWTRKIQFSSMKITGKVQTNENFNEEGHFYWHFGQNVSQCLNCCQMSVKASENTRHYQPKTGEKTEIFGTLHQFLISGKSAISRTFTPALKSEFPLSCWNILHSSWTETHSPENLIPLFFLPLRNPSSVSSDDFGDKTPGSCEKDSQSFAGEVKRWKMKAAALLFHSCFSYIS